MEWIQNGRSPRARTARAVADALGVDAGWLLADSEEWTQPTPTGLEALLRMIPADQREHLIAILRDPNERAAWIAAFLARRGPRA